MQGEWIVSEGLYSKCMQGELIHFRRSISVARGIDSFQKVYKWCKGN